MKSCESWLCCCLFLPCFSCSSYLAAAASMPPPCLVCVHAPPSLSPPRSSTHHASLSASAHPLPSLFALLPIARFVLRFPPAPQTSTRTHCPWRPWPPPCPPPTPPHPAPNKGKPPQQRLDLKWGSRRTWTCRVRFPLAPPPLPPLSRSALGGAGPLLCAPSPCLPLPPPPLLARPCALCARTRPFSLVLWRVERWPISVFVKHDACLLLFSHPPFSQHTSTQPSIHSRRKQPPFTTLYNNGLFGLDRYHVVRHVRLHHPLHPCVRRGIPGPGPGHPLRMRPHQLLVQPGKYLTTR